MYSNLTPPDQWITSVIVPLPKKGDLSLMTNYRGISLLSIAAKVYNKILLSRIRDEVDPILRNNQAGFCLGRSCTQQILILRRILEGFRDCQLPLVVTFIDFIPSTGMSCSYLIHLTSPQESCREIFWLLFYLLCWFTACWKRPRRSLTLEL